MLRQELESAQDAKRFFEEELISLREEKESLEASSQSGVFSESLPEMREKVKVNKLTKLNYHIILFEEAK